MELLPQLAGVSEGDRTVLKPSLGRRDAYMLYGIADCFGSMVENVRSRSTETDRVIEDLRCHGELQRSAASCAELQCR